jgi:hypothetical protein
MSVWTRVTCGTFFGISARIAISTVRLDVESFARDKNRDSWILHGVKIVLKEMRRFKWYNSRRMI